MNTSNSIHFYPRNKKRGIQLTIDFLSSLPCIQSVSLDPDTDEITWEYKWTKFRLAIETFKNGLRTAPTPCSFDLLDLLQGYLVEHGVDSKLEWWE